MQLDGHWTLNESPRIGRRGRKNLPEPSYGTGIRRMDVYLHEPVDK